MPQITAYQGSRRHDRVGRGLTPGRPMTDANYHSVGQLHSGDSASQRSISTPGEHPSFRDISREFLSEESHQSFCAELFLFGVIILVSTWPLFALVEAWTALPG
jgi:hypothetical protein